MNALGASDPRDPAPARTVVDYWQSGRAWWDVTMDSHASAATLAAEARARARALIRFAYAHSALYRRLYGPRREHDGLSLAKLPHVSKPQLMDAFDEWVTDPAVTRAGVEEFLRDPSRVGQGFLGRYAVWTSSGTSGYPGIFLHDARALAVYDALEAVRFRRLESPLAIAASLFDADRFAMVAATGGHFTGNASVARIRMANAALASRVRIFSIMDPIWQLTDALNAYRPTMLATYPSSAVLLAREAERGNLRVKLRELCTGGESLSPSDRNVLRRVFGCPVRDDYGSSEFPPTAFDCSRGTLHVNADWVILEAVDRHFRPVPPGEPSHTVLLTNLANFVQPIIRYDLGDSVTLQTKPCACGSPFPALHVEGRRDDIVSVTSAGGREVALLPLALETVLEEEGHVSRFQLVQTGPASFCLRLSLPVEQEGAWTTAESALQRYLASQGLGPIQIERDPYGPRAEPGSGKLRHVIALPCVAPKSLDI